MVEGLWTPHTSSVDFCEKNYGSMYEVVELHNTWSSLAGISLFGLIGLWKGNPTGDLRYALGYFILVLIGLGSAGLHGTLHWVFQSSDELPMIYLVTLMNFMAVEVDSPRNNPAYPRLPLILSIIMVVNTFVYYTFQHLYFVFITTYTCLSTYHFYLAYITMFKNNKGGKVCRSLFLWSQGSYLGGFLFWLVDMLLCDYSNLGKGMTFHVIWHFGAGFGGYLIIVTYEICRARALNIKCELAFLFGLIPYVKRLEDVKRD